MLPLLWFPSCHISRPSGRLFRYQVMRQCDELSLGKETSPRDVLTFYEVTSLVKLPFFIGDKGSATHTVAPSFADLIHQANFL